METRQWARIGFGVSSLLSGAYLALPWFTNSSGLNTFFGWVLGLLGALVLLVDGFQKNWKDKVMIAAAIVGLLAAFYLIPTWVPNNSGANIAFGVLLIVGGAASFIKR